MAPVTAPFKLGMAIGEALSAPPDFVEQTAQAKDGEAKTPQSRGRKKPTSEDETQKASLHPSKKTNFPPGANAFLRICLQRFDGLQDVSAVKVRVKCLPAVVFNGETITPELVANVAKKERKAKWEKEEKERLQEQLGGVHRAELVMAGKKLHDQVREKVDEVSHAVGENLADGFGGDEEGGPLGGPFAGAFSGAVPRSPRGGLVAAPAVEAIEEDPIEARFSKLKLSEHHGRVSAGRGGSSHSTSTAANDPRKLSPVEDLLAREQARKAEQLKEQQQKRVCSSHKVHKLAEIQKHFERFYGPFSVGPYRTPEEIRSIREKIDLLVYLNRKKARVRERVEKRAKKERALAAAEVKNPKKVVMVPPLARPPLRRLDLDAMADALNLDENAVRAYAFEGRCVGAGTGWLIGSVSDRFRTGFRPVSDQFSYAQSTSQYHVGSAESMSPCHVRSAECHVGSSECPVGSAGCMHSLDRNSGKQSESDPVLVRNRSVDVLVLCVPSSGAKFSGVSSATS